MQTDPIVCTLTFKDDYRGEYEDSLRYVRAERNHIAEAKLGNKRLTRSTVRMLSGWVSATPHCKRDELKVLGSALYEIAFGEPNPADPTSAPMRRAFEDTLSTCKKVNQRVRLRLVIQSTAVELGKYPWEFLFLDREGNGGGFFLAGGNIDLTLTRYVPNSDTWQEASDDGDGRLRILVVHSAPRIPEMTELKVRSFVDQLLALDTKRFNAQGIESPTRKELREGIEEMQPHVIHFIGHGRPNQLALKKNDLTIAREREDFAAARELGRVDSPVSEADWIDAETASGILRAGLERPDAPQRLIFLHACEGATAAETTGILEGFNSVAGALIGGDGRITGVIAMQYTIAVDEAEIFAKLFYEEISQGHHVDEAVRSARARFAETPLRGSEQSWENRAWGTPVIYLRSERPLIVPPSPREPRKEPCPNPDCQAFVMRSRSPCRKCEYPFTECPKCHDGLVVPKPGFRCSDCDYVYLELTLTGPTDAPAGATDKATVEPSRAPEPDSHLEQRARSDITGRARAIDAPDESTQPDEISRSRSDPDVGGLWRSRRDLFEDRDDNQG